jgi:hypothetical protein
MILLALAMILSMSLGAAVEEDQHAYDQDGETNPDSPIIFLFPQIGNPAFARIYDNVALGSRLTLCHVSLLARKFHKK